MKKFIYTLLLSIPSVMFAQLGIGTTNPTRMVDVEGDLRVTNLQDVSSKSDYSELVTANKNGNVDKITFLALDQNDNVDVEVTKTNYLSNTANENIAGGCGILGFRLKNNNGNADFELRLKDDKIFSDLNAENFTINFGGKYFGENKSYSNINYSLKFELDKVTKIEEQKQHLQFRNVKSNIPLNEINVFTILLPKQYNLYRITISRLTNSSSNTLNTLNVMVCEKFYIKQVGS